MAEIQLPGKSLIQAYPTGGEVSLSSAAAPARALQQVGNAVQQLGEKGLAMVEDHLRVDNLRMANEMELRANEVYSQFQMDAANDGDPKTLPGRWTKVLKEFEAKNLGKNLTPAQKSVLGERFSQFASNTTVNIAKNAFQENIRQSKISSSNIIEQSMRMGNFDRGFSEVNSMVGAKMISSAEGETLKMDLRQKSESYQVEAQAKIDPLGTQEQLDAKDESGGWKNFSNLDPSNRDRLSNVAKTQVRQAVVDATNHALDGIATGDIGTQEQLKSKVSGLVPPRVFEQLESERRRKWTAGVMAQRETPEYQRQTMGKVSAMLADFKPNDPDFDTKLVDMSIMISHMPAGAAKNTLSGQLQKAIKGDPEDKSYGEFVLRQMDERNKSFKRLEPEKLTIQGLVKSGFLKDEEKMKRLGYNEAKAKAIKEAAKTDPAAAQKLFAESWKGRVKGSLNASEFEIATADSIRLGKGVVNWNDPKSEEEVKAKNAAIDDQFGLAKMKMIQFLQLKPDASIEEIDQAHTTYTGQQVRSQASGGLVGSRPVMSGGYTASDALLPSKTGDVDEVQVDSINGSSTFRYDPSTDPNTLDVPSDEELLPVR